MNNPNNRYVLDHYIQTIGEALARHAEVNIPKLIEARWAFWNNIIKGGKFDYKSEPRICIQKADWSSIIPPVEERPTTKKCCISTPDNSEDWTQPLRIKDPLLCIIYDAIVGKAQRMYTSPKIWVPDTLQRDPLKLAGAIAQAVIHFFMRRKGFDDWWHGIDELRRDEIRAGLACDIAMSLPRHPEEATIKYAQQRTVPLEEAQKPNPNWVDVDPIWVAEAMVPSDMPRLGARVWEDADCIRSETQLDRADIIKWLQRTAIKMAKGKYVNVVDKNRFTDLANLIGWED